MEEGEEVGEAAEGTRTVCAREEEVQEGGVKPAGRKSEACRRKECSLQEGGVKPAGGRSAACRREE